MNGLTFLFHGKGCCNKQLHIIDETKSVLNRYSRDTSFMTHNSLEQMKVFTTHMPTRPERTTAPEVLQYHIRS